MAEAAGVTGAAQAVANKVSAGMKNISGKLGIGSKAQIAGGRNAEGSEEGGAEGGNKEETSGENKDKFDGGAKPNGGGSKS